MQRKHLVLWLVLLQLVVFTLPLPRASAQDSEVSDTDIQKIFDEAKAEASKVSAELKEFVDGAKLGDKNATGLVDQSARFEPRKKYRKEEIHSSISKKEIKEGLEGLKRADEKDRPALREDLLEQIIGDLLHEAGHWKAFVDGTRAPSEAGDIHKPSDPRVEGPEEKRNTEALINRLTGIMSQLKLKCKPAGESPSPEQPNLGDGAGLKDEKDPSLWMKRLRKIVEQQIVYRFEKGCRIEPWNGKRKTVTNALKNLKARLEEIQKNSTDKDKDAQAARDQFIREAGEAKGDLEKEFDVKLDPKWDPKTFELQPLEAEPTGQFQGKSIPDCPDTKDEKKGSGSSGNSQPPNSKKPKALVRTTRHRAQKKCPSSGGGIVGAINDITNQMGGCQK